MSDETVVEITPLDSWDAADFIPESTEVISSEVEDIINADSEIQPETVEKQQLLDEKEPVSEENDNIEAKNEDSASEKETVEEKPELIKVKVAGKEEEVTLEELKTNYSGKVAYDKKFTELDKERKAFLKEKTQIESYVNQFRETATNQNMVEATKFLGQLTGKAPHQVVEELIQSLTPEIERRMGLMDSELEYENKLADAQYKADLLEQKQSQLENEQVLQTLDAKIESIMSDKSITTEEWDKAVRELDNQLPKEQALTPELVAEFVHYERSIAKTDSILNTFEDGKYLSNDSVKNTLRDIAIDNPDFTNEDLIEILSNSVQTSTKKQVEEKLVKKTSNTPKQQQQVSQFKQLTSWDDIL